MVQVAQTSWLNWVKYFQNNAVNLMSTAWDAPDLLTEPEIRHIKTSIQQFQLGESSEGKHLIAQAKRYSVTSGDPSYLAALQLFIQEEHRHSSYLARFLKKHGFPLVEKDKVDSIFRLLRHTFNLELSVMAMLTAEVIAVPYYKALHDATDSLLLRQICRQILRDEMQHLQFQADALKAIRRNYSRLHEMLIRIVHRVLLTGTIYLVWQQHHDVFIAGNYGFTRFWRVSWVHFNRLFAKRSARSSVIAQIH